MLTVLVILWVIALLLTVAAAMDKVPLWAPVFVVCVAGLVSVLPVR